jgi:hypothetical protein
MKTGAASSWQKSPGRTLGGAPESQPERRKALHFFKMPDGKFWMASSATGETAQHAQKQGDMAGPSQSVPVLLGVWEDQRK